MVAPRALADGTMSGDGFAVGVDAAVTAGVDAFEVTTRLCRAALGVRLALMSAAR